MGIIGILAYPKTANTLVHGLTITKNELHEVKNHHSPEGFITLSKRINLLI